MKAPFRTLWEHLAPLDEHIIKWLKQYGHRLHRLSLEMLFVWLGLLKPMGHETATSLLAHIVYWGSPDLVVVVLGWWEVLIGLAMFYRPFVRIALFLLLIRIPGTLLAFILLPEIHVYPLSPRPYA